MKQTYFMHYRKTDDAGNKQPKGGATVAIRVVEGDKLAIAMTLCSTKDVFCKSRGRMIAEGRLNAYLEGRQVDPHVVLTVDDHASDESIKTTVDEVLGDRFAEMGYF